MRFPKHVVYKIVRSIVSLFGISKARPVVISFTGGMGAQLISAAIYLDLKYQGYDVYADFRYFEEKIHPRLEYSLWGWQLDCFGLTMRNFKRYDIQNLRLISAMHVKDGPIKTRLVLEAIEKTHVLNALNSYTKEFKELAADFIHRTPLLSGAYACVHLRRGDYLKVASYVVPEDHFLEVLYKIRNLVGNLVIISDSPVSSKFKEAVNNTFNSTIFYDSNQIDFALSHYIMKSAKILICSNSQFSWTAGKLSKGLVLVPNKWFGGRGLESKMSPVREGSFSLI